MVAFKPLSFWVNIYLLLLLGVSVERAARDTPALRSKHNVFGVIFKLQCERGVVA